MENGQSLRLGVIGSSEGNGHPYSWAAIFNGYDAAAMASCPFPVIPAYLARQSFPADAIPGARVTCVWTQDRAEAEHIARASLIPTVVERYQDMVGQVDAVLLARDDAENHLEMSRPFLDAGLPVYIDKPVALTLRTLEALFALQQRPGQIFSCSALKYAREFELTEAVRRELGTIRSVAAVSPKSWEKYGAHIVDPVLRMFSLSGKDCRVGAKRVGATTEVAVEWENFSATFANLGPAAGDIRITLVGEKGSKEMVFKDSFAAFKRTLEIFVEGVRTGNEMIAKTDMISFVSILERGAL